MTCEYFGRYSGETGKCVSRATLELTDNGMVPRLKVCFLHARVIVSRYPGLGGIAERFKKIEDVHTVQLEELPDGVSVTRIRVHAKDPDRWIFDLDAAAKRLLTK